MQNVIDDFFYSLFAAMGIDAGVFFIVYTIVFVIVIAFLVRRIQVGGKRIPDGVMRIIASTGDVSAGIVGTRKLKFIRTPATALTFLKIEENAVQQALSAIDYFAQQGEIDEPTKSKILEVYQARLDAVRTAIARDQELREVIDASSAVDKARSDYLRKLAAMSGTTVEPETETAGPTSVGLPSAARPPSPRPGAGAPSGAPSGGPPSGGPPSGGPPSGAPPSGGPPSGGAPSGAPASGGPPGAASSPSTIASTAGPGGPPSGGPAGASGPPGGMLPAGGPAVTAGSRPTAGAGKSSLQSEMLAEMERLRALMGE